MKKTSLIALLFLISMVILAFSSCFSFSSGGLLFTEVDGGYQVTGVSLKDRFYKNFTIEIPSEYNGKPVVAISDDAFAFYTSLVKITIPDTVTHIGDGAFMGCALLQEITLPTSLTHIGNNVFFNTNLKNIVIPENVVSIGDEAFDNSSLISIEVDENNQYFKSSDKFNHSRFRNVYW